MTTLPLSGGSAVCRALRAVVAEDEALSLFGDSETPLAVAVKAAIHEDSVPAPRPAPNATATWLAANPGVYQTLVKHLSAKMVKSRTLDVVEDHVQTFLTRLVEKDTLAPFLKGGKPVQMSVLRIWAYQSASTDFRRWGTDASLRTTRGAKTSREVQQGKAFRPVVSATAAREVVREGYAEPDLHDPTEASPEETLDRKSRVEQVRRHFTRIGQPNMVPVIDGLLAGESLPDLCAAHGVSADQIRIAIRGLRA